MKILLVGGAVRNLLLGRPVVDKDFLVSGISREGFAEHFPKAREAGVHFPIFILEGDEYSLLRADTIENDLLLRDFTINAIAMKENGSLIAHPQALHDLSTRKLSPCGEKSFHDDPLRVFRAARFLSELHDFEASDTLLSQMREISVNGITAQVSAERVGKELLRALQGDVPSRFLELLQETNHLEPWFREFASAASIPAGPAQYHSRSVLGHTQEVMDRLAGQGAIRVWMGLVHDIGKCTTPDDILPAHRNHEQRGMELASALGTRLRLPNTFIKAGQKAARWHMLASRYRELRPGTRVDLLQTLGSRTAVEDLFAVSRADRASSIDLSSEAIEDFEHMKTISLPKKYRNLGPDSGKMLREMRAAALAGRGVESD